MKISFAAPTKFICRNCRKGSNQEGFYWCRFCGEMICEHCSLPLQEHVDEEERVCRDCLLVNEDTAYVVLDFPESDDGPISIES